MHELDIHDVDIKKYLIVTIKTIDFPDSRGRGIMRAWTRATTPSKCSRRTVWTAPGPMPDAGGSFAALPSCPPPRRRSDATDGRVEIRAARETDLAQIAAIWNHEVLCTDATTDTEPRDAVAQREWFARHTERYPVVVAAVASDDPERDDDVVAYGSLSPYRSKPAFARTVEDSVYVERGRRGEGLGGLILSELIRRARALEHHSILARITAKNTASLRLHARHGFRPVGVERESAFKLGRWHDVTILQRRRDSR
jgi:L-amino acid N-acyltransferase YncA